MPKCLTNPHDFGMRRVTVGRGNRPNEVTLINHGAVLLRELCSSGVEFEAVYKAPLATLSGRAIVSYGWRFDIFSLGARILRSRWLSRQFADRRGIG